MKPGMLKKMDVTLTFFTSTTLLPISLEIRSYPEENFHDFGTKPSEITEYRNRYQESYGGCTFFAACRNLSHHQGKG